TQPVVPQEVATQPTVQKPAATPAAQDAKKEMVAKERKVLAKVTNRRRVAFTDGQIATLFLHKIKTIKRDVTISLSASQVDDSLLREGILFPLRSAQVVEIQEAKRKGSGVQLLITPEQLSRWDLG